MQRGGTYCPELLHLAQLQVLLLWHLGHTCVEPKASQAWHLGPGRRSMEGLPNIEAAPTQEGQGFRE